MSKRNVLWTADALRKLNSITDYISERYPAAARRLQEAFLPCAERVALHPQMYRKGRAPGTREAVVHPNYLMVYKVEPERIIIASVIHARQQYP